MTAMPARHHENQATDTKELKHHKLGGNRIPGGAAPQLFPRKPHDKGEQWQHGAQWHIDVTRTHPIDPWQYVHKIWDAYKQGTNKGQHQNNWPVHEPSPHARPGSKKKGHEPQSKTHATDSIKRVPLLLASSSRPHRQGCQQEERKGTTIHEWAPGAPGQPGNLDWQKQYGAAQRGKHQQ